MRILPIRTPTLVTGDHLAAILCIHAPINAGDIIVISSKAIATAEGAAIDLRTITPSKPASDWAAKTGSRSPAFIQAVLNETERLHGKVTGTCPGALLTEVRPDGLPKGSILTANAGLDESNVGQNFCIGWPKDPVASARMLRSELEKKTSGRIAVIITDSCCRPRRLGVTAFALTVSGIQPLVPQMGRDDLFGKKLHITTEAVADQIATAANFVMGNAGQSVPAAIIRDHGLELSNFEGWVPGIEPEEDLFKGII
jgi:coenzyme F420-0:L-glutamate ligase / coenzyme F420-1:gamma-L-glutamate ligase